VRGVRSPEYLDQLAETDRHVGDFLAFLEERGKLDDATVILMADHGQGRGIGGHGHLDWGERPVPFVVWGEGAVPGAISDEPRSVLELAVTVARLLGVPAPEAARGRPLLPAYNGGEGGVSPQASCPGALYGTPSRMLGPESPAGRVLAVVVARDEAPSLPSVLSGLPREAAGLPVDVLLVDDGSTDATPDIGRAHGARVHSHASSRGLGAALRAGIEIARDEGYAATVYIDGDGEYDPAGFERVLDPIARGRADYVLGSRFLGEREGMSWHRTLSNRAASALVGFLTESVTSDAQTGFRAFSARALAEARIAHDYNYAQILTLSLWGAGIEPLEVPVRYRRRTSGRSFVRYPEYLARVAPAVWREWRAARASRAARSASATPIAPASQYGQPPPGSNNGHSSVSGPNGASGRSVTSEPPPRRTSA
jgi:hypothetical protein